jgi:hypothetical protein
MAQILTVDGKMYHVRDELDAQALFFECLKCKGDNALLKVETATKIRFIPVHQIKEIIFYEKQE